MKLTPYQYGQYALIGMSGIFFGMVLNGAFVSIFGIRKMIFAGMFIIILNSFILFAAYLINFLSIEIIIIPTFFMALTTTFILPNTIVGAFSPFQKIAGTAGAVYGFLQILITSIISVIISFFNQPSELLLSIITDSLMSLTYLICFSKFSK